MTDRTSTAVDDAQREPESAATRANDTQADDTRAAGADIASDRTSERAATDAPSSDSGSTGSGLSTADIAGSNRPGSQSSETVASTGAANATAQGDAALFDAASATDLRERWQAIQVEFVDEPRGAVEKADGLVAEVMKKLAEEFASERQDLESAWSGGNEASTEDLRQAIRRYRSFFNRLLAI
jgi:hypothetical protein